MHNAKNYDNYIVNQSYGKNLDVKDMCILDIWSDVGDKINPCLKTKKESLI